MHHARLLRSSVAFVALASWLVVASGCPGTLTEEEKKMFQGGGSCPDVPSLLTAKCGLAGCHGPGSTPDLGSPGVEARIVGKPASATCGGTVLANPAAPEESLLYKKLTDAPGCGSKMPIGASLPPLEIDCIRDWIGTLDPNAGTGGSAGGGGGGGAGGAGGSGGT